MKAHESPTVSVSFWVDKCHSLVQVDGNLIEFKDEPLAVGTVGFVVVLVDSPEEWSVAPGPIQRIVEVDGQWATLEDVEQSRQ